MQSPLTSEPDGVRRFDETGGAQPAGWGPNSRKEVGGPYPGPPAANCTIDYVSDRETGARHRDVASARDTRPPTCCEPGSARCHSRSSLANRLHISVKRR